MCPLVPLPFPWKEDVLCIRNSFGKGSACNAGGLFRFLGWEDALEKETATYSTILAWRIPWTEEPGRLQSMGSEELDMT